MFVARRGLQMSKTWHNGVLQNSLSPYYWHLDEQPTRTLSGIFISSEWCQILPSLQHFAVGRVMNSSYLIEEVWVSIG